jgi:hypothetical protein
MIKKYVVSILIIFLTFNCQRSKNSDSYILEINPADTSRIGFSKYFELEKYIVLETSKASVMQDIRKTIIANGKIFILTWGDPQVLIFDMNGKFLSQFKKYGTGPGEYTYVVDMSVSRKGDTICLYDKSLKKILKYNQDGEFLFYVDLNVDLETFAFLQNGNIIGYSFLNHVMPLNDTLFQLWFFDASGKIIAGKLPIRKENMGDSFGSASTFNLLASGSYFIPYTENVIYKITGDPQQFKPLYRFDFKDKTMPPDILEMPRKDRQEAFNNSFILSGEYAGSRSLLVNIYSLKDRTGLVAIYNLKNKSYSLIRSKNLWDESSELPIATNMQNTYYGQDRLIAIANVLKLHDHAFIDEKTSGFELKQKTKVTDNPVLLIYKEK